MKTSAIKAGSLDDEDDEITPPLFVRIQTIDLRNLDFQTNIGSTAKFRNLTYVEATNLFLFVGSTSGTVYVFSRDSLKFLFIIPFKGGKVCNIACSQDESDIAVGSIRGKVSIYRISPNVHYMQSTATTQMIDAFRDIYDVPHHVGTEITELQWSPNGKYLFVGDSQGTVSQMDVACLEEFPRPVPSKIILKLQSRILQIDCSFPYLAVCTLAAVYLCDLEKEDFTRVQCIKNTDINSTGLSLMILPESSSLRDLERERTIPSAKLILFIGEARTGTIHLCNMEGNVQFSRKVQISDKVSKYSMSLFDPTKPACAPLEMPPTAGNNGVDGGGSSGGVSAAEETDEPVNISLGKMLCTDDGMIVSVSSDRLYVYDPHTLNVIAWNDDFKRINNFKIISNYVFIWSGNKLDVVAFTPFRPYGEQLFRAKLIDVLESWIVHTVYALGWRLPFPSPTVPQLVEDEEPESSGNGLNGSAQEEPHPSPALEHSISNLTPSEKVIWNFRRMMFGESEEESEFTRFVGSHLPFPLSVSSNKLDISSPDDSSDSLLERSNGDNNKQLEELELERNRMEKPVQLFLTQVESALQLINPPTNPTIPSRIAPSISSSSSISDNHFVMSNDTARIFKTISQNMKRFRGPTAASKGDSCFQFFSQVWKALLDFYENVDCALPQVDYKKSDLTLAHVIHAAHNFLSQPKLVSLHREISGVCDISKFEDVAIQLICCLYCQPSQFKHCASSDTSTATVPGGDSKLTLAVSNNNLFTLCFTKFTQCPLVTQWFRELGIVSESLFYDGLLTDTLLLLVGLLPRDPNDDFASVTLLPTCLDALGMYDKLPKYFITWLFLCRFLHKPKQVPFSPLLRTLLNEQLFEKMAEEMFSTIYREFRLSSLGSAVLYLHHFVTTLVLLSKSPSYGQTRNVSILLTCFPLTKWAREDIVAKVIAACHLNQSLLGLYLKACLEDGNSLKLCACGIQAGYGSLEGKISSWQKAIEEAIIKLLLEEYFKSSPYDEDEEHDSVPDGNGNSTQKRRTEMLVHMFAMRRGLLETYFRSPLPDEFLSEEMQAELIVRSGSCSPLKYFQANEQNMSLLLKCYHQHFERSSGNMKSLMKTNLKPKNGLDSHKARPPSSSPRKQNGETGKSKGKRSVQSTVSKCRICNTSLPILTTGFKPFTRDCLGFWALKQVGSVKNLMKLVQNCHLNVPGMFSARFYSAVIKYNQELSSSKSKSNYDLDFEEPTHLTCDIFH